MSNEKTESTRMFTAHEHEGNKKTLPIKCREKGIKKEENRRKRMKKHVEREERIDITFFQKDKRRERLSELLYV
jgi:hypothetical protein